jgi:hypothetical protein
MRRIATLNRCVLHGALVMLERSAGKLARSVLRGLSGREPTWLPGGHLYVTAVATAEKASRSPEIVTRAASPARGGTS